MVVLFVHGMGRAPVSGWPLLHRLRRAGDCGQLPGCATRMQAIAPITVPAAGIAGVRSLPGSRARFGDEANDGVVSVGEVSAPWLTKQIEVPVVHTLLPSSGRVAEIILRGLSLSSPNA